MSITEPTQQIIVYLDAEGNETEDYSKARTAKVFTFYENGDLAESKTVLLDATIQEAQQTWNEEEHPRDEKGKFADKGETGEPTKQKPTYGQVPQGQVPAGEGRGFESIDLSEKPSPAHIQTADDVLSYFQSQGKSFDRNFMIQQAHRADFIRNVAENNSNAITQTLQQNFPNGRASYRVKKRYNMLEKLGRKPDKYKSVDDLNDIAGVRLEFTNIYDAQQAMPYIEANFEITEKEDYISKPNGGYRSVHYLVKNPDGTVAELQVRTQNETKFGDWAHDFYKPPTREMSQWVEPNRQQITQYMEQVGDYYYNLDIGMYAEPPPCPEVIISHERCI